MNAKTTIRIDEDLLLKVRHRCLDEGITLQRMVELALQDYLKKPLEKERKAQK